MIDLRKLVFALLFSRECIDYRGWHPLNGFRFLILIFNDTIIHIIMNYIQYDYVIYY